MTDKYPYIYKWGNNAERAKYKGKLCHVLARFKLNSVLLKFKDGSLLVTSRNAIRKFNPMEVIHD